MSTQEAAGGASGAVQATGVAPEFLWRARALIVDDIAENRLMLGLCCDQFGVFHESVGSGSEAVDAARSGRFDVILMDIFMPGMDGMAATRAIRALPGPGSAAPIIAVTTAAAPGEVLRYLDCGMTDVVSKPINPSRLAHAMSAALAQGRRDMRPSRSKAFGRNAARRRA